MNKKYERDIGNGLRYVRKPKGSKWYSKAEERRKIDEAMKDFFARGERIERPGDKGKHYIYFLIDTRNGEVFYVGKGQGNRLYEHVLKARKNIVSNNNYGLYGRIREIEGAGYYVKQKIVWRTDDEQRAYDMERFFIDRVVDKTKLLNIKEGGRGRRKTKKKTWRPTPGYLKDKWDLDSEVGYRKWLDDICALEEKFREESE